MKGKRNKVGFRFIRMAEPNIEYVEYSYKGNTVNKFHAKKMINRVMHNKYFNTIEECRDWLNLLIPKSKGAQKGRQVKVHEITEGDEFMYLKSNKKFLLSSYKDSSGLCCINIDGYIQQVSWDSLVSMVINGKIIKISE